MQGKFLYEGILGMGTSIIFNNMVLGRTGKPRYANIKSLFLVLIGTGFSASNPTHWEGGRIPVTSWKVQGHRSDWLHMWAIGVLPFLLNTHLYHLSVSLLQAGSNLVNQHKATDLNFFAQLSKSCCIYWSTYNMPHSDMWALHHGPFKVSTW